MDPMNATQATTELDATLATTLAHPHATMESMVMASTPATPTATESTVSPVAILNTPPASTGSQATVRGCVTQATTDTTAMPATTPPTPCVMKG